MPEFGLEYIDAAIDWVRLVGSLIVGLILFVGTWLRNDNTKAHERIDKLETDVCTKEDLKSGLEPIQTTQQTILNNLLLHRDTELTAADPNEPQADEKGETFKA